jgi:superfamily II DNA/RNA helicase
MTEYECDDFEKMDFLQFELFKGICNYGFQRPSKIQTKTIKAINTGIDVIAQSQSGTGKTGAFLIGALSRVDPNIKHPQVIIVANTRELSMQIQNVAKHISFYMNLNICLCIGLGQDVVNNLKDAEKSHILIGTPGRLGDILAKLPEIVLDNVKTLVLDEADVLLKIDFVDQIKKITACMPLKTQICLFSATYNDDILEISKMFMKPNAFIVKIPSETLSLELIKQYKIVMRSEKQKYSTLEDLYKKLSISQAIIFVNSIKRAEILAGLMIKNNYAIGILHGKMTSRDDVLKDFRTGKTRVLLSTDILSRGIDVEQVGIVINYDLPDDKHQYIHRIGRSGRFGKFGIAINLITDRDLLKLQEIETYYNIALDDMPQPSILNTLLTGTNYS